METKRSVEEMLSKMPKEEKAKRMFIINKKQAQRDANLASSQKVEEQKVNKENVGIKIKRKLYLFILWSLELIAPILIAIIYVEICQAQIRKNTSIYEIVFVILFFIPLFYEWVKRKQNKEARGVLERNLWVMAIVLLFLLGLYILQFIPKEPMPIQQTKPRQPILTEKKR